MPTSLKAGSNSFSLGPKLRIISLARPQTQVQSVHSFLVRDNADNASQKQHTERQHSPASLTITLEHMTSF